MILSRSFSILYSTPNFSNTLKRVLYLLLLLLFYWALSLPALAQEVPEQATVDSLQNLAPNWPDDSLGRRTPRGTVYGFIKAVADKNYNRAALYLNIDPNLKTSRSVDSVAMALQDLLDQHGEILPYSWISDEYSGRTDNELGPTLERVGEASLNGEDFDIFVEQVSGPNNAPVWLFSSQTVQRIPVPVKNETIAPLNRVLPDALQENTWGGVPIGHWFSIVLLALICYLVARGIIWVIFKLIPIVWKKAQEETTAGVIRAFALPLRLYLAVLLFVYASNQIGISIIVRLRLSEITLIVGFIAFLLLIWRLLDFIARYAERRMQRRNNQAAVSALLFLRRGFKIALIAIGIFVALDTFGFDVTAGLAALGIGGIALALGAQKTVENFVGSVTLIADQPVRVGDFCKVGSITGTVEQIGMRSTRIRTAERTVVTIPNGEFSSLYIENFAFRDRFLFNPKLGLRYETTPDQIRYLLVEIRSMLYAHPKVSPDPARVRFIEFGKDALTLEVYSYILADDFDEFAEVREDLLLRIMDLVAASGTGLAFTSQTLYFAKDSGVSEEKAQEVSVKVKEWREAGEMQLPSFDNDHIQRLKDTIVYPPEGSSFHGKK